MSLKYYKKISQFILHQYCWYQLIYKINYLFWMIGSLMSQESIQKSKMQQPYQYQNVYHSLDGCDQRIKLNHLQIVQHKFIKCLNNLIRHQNMKNKQNIIVLPYQNNQLYIHFSDEKSIQKLKVQESTDSTFISVPRPSFPMIAYQAYPQFYQSFPQEQYTPLQYQITNPILQSQDRFLSQPKQTQQMQHFRTADFQFRGSNNEDSESIDPNVKDNSDKSNRLQRIKKIRKGKVNDTKNITKNFSKAIISYIMQNKDIGLKIMNNIEFEEFVSILKEKKNQMTNIKQLRDLWVETDDIKSKQFNKAFRIFSEYFLKSQSVSYIYNSRIANTGWHLKYRYNLLRALKEPENFKYIKDI